MIRAALGLLLGLVIGQTSAAEAQVCGTAQARDDGRVEYRELHYDVADGRRIEYRGADSELIATNELYYGDSPTAPAHLQRDFRAQRDTGARWRDGNLLLYRDGTTRQVEVSKPVVISAGFDQFVRDNWQRLDQGEAIEFDFSLPNRLRMIRLRMFQIRDEETPITDIAEDWTLFRITASNGLLRLFVPAIDLAYDRQQRLRVYQGLSNLAAAQGGGLDVDIRYQYPGEDAAFRDCLEGGADPRSDLMPGAKTIRF